MSSIDPNRSALGVSAPPSPEPTLSGSNKSMGKDQFLQLLTAQLQNQDPLEPQKNHEFVAQLAQFSGLEQQISVNKNLQGLMTSQSSMANAQLSGLIGKDIISQGGRVQVDHDKAQPFSFELSDSAQDVRVTIYDQQNQAVATKELGALRSGPHEINWNGLNNQNVALAPGSYRFEIKAKDGNDNPVTVSSQGRGTVTGITFEQGFPELIVGDGKVLPADIVQIIQGKP